MTPDEALELARASGRAEGLAAPPPSPERAQRLRVLLRSALRKIEQDPARKL